MLNEGRKRLYELSNSLKEKDFGFDIIPDMLISILQ